MNNDIAISCDLHVGTGFIPQNFLQAGEDEYRFRDRQLMEQGKSQDSFRRLKPFELETLVRQHNTCTDWSMLLVSDPFTPELIHNTAFAGLVRIGKLDRVALEHHDLHMPAGITNSQIIACDIGDNCAIINCTYIAHYIIGDHCILIDNAEIHVSNHAKFGNGCVMEGEPEDVRITIDVMNEAGGRSIQPFVGMKCSDAYLWAKYRDRDALQRQFARMTDSMFDTRRGRYGTIGTGSVLKSNGIIKDVAIGESAYIKGANKLKNLTIRSREDARTQIGEGVELVNGIIGYGSKVFYGSKAVRFILGDNSSLKYGARLIHSILGENSTVSCCEILNNLIFPSHEQHHNTSFLIASLIKGQSNMAAGATIGSNHNSRAPDGEIEAGRGFWPGLCTSVKHSSRFASFCLLAKGDYRYELDIPFPFCLVDNDYRRDRLVLVPAYWWTANQYALMRNEGKFVQRDGRCDKRLRIEFSPFAPDTAVEIRAAMSLLERLTGQAFVKAIEALGESGIGPEEFERLRSVPGISAALAKAGTAGGDSDLRALGRAVLSAGMDILPFEVMAEDIEHSDRGCEVRKPVRAWKAYREMLLWYAGREVAAAIGERMKSGGGAAVSFDALAAALEPDAHNDASVRWENLGGMLVAAPRLEELLQKAEAGDFNDWDSFHVALERLSDLYPQDKLHNAWATLGLLYPDDGAAKKPDGTRASGPGRTGILEALEDLAALAARISTGVYESRAKDYSNRFRASTFRNEAEMKAVLGTAKENSSIVKTKAAMEAFITEIEAMKTALR
jgi:hypothetical protein